MSWLLVSLSLAEPITLSQSYQQADMANAQLQIARWTTAKAKIQSQQAWLGLLPQVQADASWLYFDEPIEISFTGDAELDCTVFDSLGFGDLCTSLAEPVVVREDQIYEGKVQAVQPLTPIYSIINGARANRALWRSAEASAKITQGDVKVSVTEAYMELHSMVGAVNLADHTVDRMKAHVRRAEAYAAQGLLTELDVRQIKQGLISAELATRQADLGRRVAQRKLELLLGKKGLEPQAVNFSQTPPVLQANDTTPVYAQAQSQMMAAKYGMHASAGQLVPTVALVGGISQTEGQGAFAANEQRFVGVTLSGDFQWGQKILQLRQSSLDVKITKSGLVATQDQQALQQESAIHLAGIAHTEWLNAKVQADLSADLLDQAEAKFEQQLISAAELLDAENDHISAETAVLTAHQNAVVALASAQNILGLPIQPEAP